MEMALGRAGVIGLLMLRVGQEEMDESDLWCVGLWIEEVLRLPRGVTVGALGDIAEGRIGEKPKAEVEFCGFGTTSGDSGGVGSLRTKVGAASNSNWNGTSKRGDWSGMVTTWGTISPSPGFASARRIGCSVMDKNSEEAVLEDRDNRGRCDLRGCGSRDSCEDSRSRVESSYVNDIGLLLSGDNSAGGLLGGTVIGLSGIWKYFVVRGRSMVAIGATDFVCVGG